MDGSLAQTIHPSAPLDFSFIDLIDADDPHVWPLDEFERVAVEVETVFVELGLTQLELPIAA